MIRLHLDTPKLVNAKVTLGRDQPIDAQCLRDAEGHLDVTFDALEPDKGELILIVLTGENDATYEGIVKKNGHELIFHSVTGGGH